MLRMQGGHKELEPISLEDTVRVIAGSSHRERRRQSIYPVLSSPSHKWQNGKREVELPGRIGSLFYFALVQRSNTHHHYAVNQLTSQLYRSLLANGYTSSIIVGTDDVGRWNFGVPFCPSDILRGTSE